MITLFGATGFTGRLTATALDRSGLPYRLAGRSNDKLEQLSASLSCRPEWLVADAADPASLPPLLRGTKILINCAGPFTDLGEKVVRAAAVSGTHYLDTTNELGFVLRLQAYSALAEKSKSTLTPACAFEVALADCAAYELSKKLKGPPLEAEIVYHLPAAGTSSGTRKSMLRSLATSWIAYAGGDWIGAAPLAGRRKVNLPGGDLDAIRIPSCESFTLPNRLSSFQNISVWMTVSPGRARLASALGPYGARLLRSVLGPLAVRVAGSGRSPTVEQAREDPFTIGVTIRNQTHALSVNLSGRGPYWLTAQILAFACKHLLENSTNRYGLLSPSQTFPADQFLQMAQTEWGVLQSPHITEGA